MVTGCRENTIINTNITPAGDSIFTDVQSIAINARTVESHFITSNYISGLSVIMGVGALNDPLIGGTEAGMYMQVVPKQSTGYSLPVDIDSFVLVLPYADFTYGDSTNSSANQTFKVYRVADTMSRTAVYYDNSFKKIFSNELGSATVNYNSLKDSLSIEGKPTKAAPHLRITLNKDRMKEILGNGNANYNSYADFLDYFRGIYVRSATQGNSISYFRLTDDGKGNTYSKAGIVAYYKIGDSVVGDQFGFSPDNCGHFNRIVNNYTTSIDTSNFLFMQSRPGLSIEISTKDVKTLPNRLVNKAELVITEVASDPKHFPSEWVYPYTVGGKGDLNNDSLLLIADASFKSNTGTSVSGLDFIDGKVRQVTINGTVYNQYVVNCPKEFQKALKEGREMTMRITGVTNGYIGAYRLKAYKTNQTGLNTPLNIHLNVVYSGIK
jgi:hypothetical protein